MKKLLFSAYWREGREHPERVLSIMPIAEGVTEAEADVLIAAELAIRTPFDAIHFVGPTRRLEPLRRSVTSAGSATRARVLLALRTPSENVDRAVLFFTFDAKNGKYSVRTLSDKPPTNHHAIEGERNGTLVKAFVDSGGDEQAPPGVHFAKTSTSHSDRFLRVSRVFEETAHLHLAAFWLLSFLWKHEPKYIVLDTTGIHALALAAVGELLISTRLETPPLIWSHNSHDGVKDLPIEVINEAVFLVSASTSGGLARRLNKKGVASDRIITCFSLLPPSADSIGSVVCDLNGGAHGGLKPIRSWSPESCEPCRQGSQVIRVEGDQFSVVPPSVELVRIEAKDFPSSARTILSTLAGRGVFRVYRRDASDSKIIRDIWADGTVALELPFARKSKALEKNLNAWKHSVSQAMTLDVTTVVASEYPGSRLLANDSLSPYKWRSDRIRGVRPRDLPDLSMEEGKASLVLTSVIDREDEFVSVSRSMRSYQPNGATYYLGLFSFFPTSKDRDGFVSTLTYGSHGRQTFRLDTQFDLNVEIDRTGGTWRRELQMLRRLQGWAANKDFDIPAEIDSRIEALERGVATGLTHDVFWPSPAKKQLALRSDFTLLDWSIEKPVVSAADLYVLLSVVLNGLRHRTDTRCLRQNPYHRAVLSPKNFDRFSDGILQASILRAARPAELAYATCGEPESGVMCRLLLDSLVNGLNDPKAEALNEFLVAIAIGNLSLLPDHVAQFATAVIDRADGEKQSATLFLARAVRAKTEWT